MTSSLLLMSMMQLHIRTPTGSSFTLTDLPATESVVNLKWSLSVHLQLHPDSLRLVFRHHELTSGTLLEHKVTSGSTLFVCPALASGPFNPLRSSSSSSAAAAAAAAPSPAAAAAAAGDQSAAAAAAAGECGGGVFLDARQVSLILQTLSPEQLEILQAQRRPLQVTARLGSKLVAFVLLPTPPAPAAAAAAIAATTAAGQTAAAFFATMETRPGFIIALPSSTPETCFSSSHAHHHDHVVTGAAAAAVDGGGGAAEYGGKSELTTGGFSSNPDEKHEKPRHDYDDDDDHDRRLRRRLRRHRSGSSSSRRRRLQNEITKLKVSLLLDMMRRDRESKRTPPPRDGMLPRLLPQRCRCNCPRY